MVIHLELIDELLKDTNPQKLLWGDGLLKQLTQALVERCLETGLHQQILVEALELCHSDVCLPDGNSACHLHHQCH